jgi:acyl-CoA reductase-like NAD-dependent aldehyde dehydrogenase
MTRETGKPIKMSRNELNGLLPRIDFFLGMVEPVDRARAGVRRSRHARGHPARPLGVVANISAWNYPWFVGCNVILPALLTGNAVLYKPSEYAAQTGLEITRLLHEAGVPRDVMACLVGAGRSARLLEQPVDGVFFTGSHATGRASRRRSPAASSSCNSSWAARTPPTSATTSTRRRPPSRWPTARCTTPARAAARSSASTCTRRSTTRSSPPS